MLGGPLPRAGEGQPGGNVGFEGAGGQRAQPPCCRELLGGAPREEGLGFLLLRGVERTCWGTHLT